MKQQDLWQFMWPVILAFKLLICRAVGTSRWERWVHSTRLCSTHCIFHNSIKYTFQFQFADVYLLIDSNGVILGIAAELLWIRLFVTQGKKGTLSSTVTLLEPWGCWLSSWYIILLVFQLSHRGLLVLLWGQELTTCILEVYWYQYGSYGNLTWRHFQIFAAVAKL